MGSTFPRSVSFPVSVRLPLPDISVASVDRISPPTSVQASPVTNTTSCFSSSRLERNFGIPMYSERFSLFTRIRLCPLALTTDRATLRQIDAVSYTHLRAHETPEHLVCR